MELRHLRYFVAVAEELHFRRAAEKLHISQPPLSLQIKDLEHELGAELFDRSRQKIALTQAGRIFLERAQAVLRSIDLAKADVRRAVDGEAGELKIGFTHSSAFVVFLPETVRGFRDRYPHVVLTLREMNSSEQVQAIAERKLDFGLMRKPKGRVPASIEVEKLCADSLVIAIPEAYPMARPKVVSIRDFADCAFICVPHNDGTGLHDAVIELCRASGFTPRIEQVVRGVQTLIGLVAAGLGVSVVPSSLQSIQRSGVVYRPLSDPAAGADLYLISSASDRGRLTTEFKEMLRSAVAKGQKTRGGGKAREGKARKNLARAARKPATPRARKTRT